MKNLEKEIENAANQKTKMYVGEESRLIKKSFIRGAKSEEAKEYHTCALKIEMVAKCTKMQVELRKNLYTEEEVKELIYLYEASNTFFKVKNEMGLPTYINNWFNENNKK